MSVVAGKRILVVEDDPILSMTLEDMLVDAGAHVLGPVAWLQEAMSLARSQPIDAAVLDININGGHSYPVAEELARRGVPIVFATGYAAEGIQNSWGAPVLRKPYGEAQLQAALRDLLG